MLNKADTTSDNSVQQRVHTAMYRILKPLIRLALAKGVNFSMLQETLKSVFVQVAEEEFKLDNRGQTDSRISLLTGLHRKDVHRLRNQPETLIAQSGNASLGSQLVGLWVSHEDFIDEDGKSKPLPRLASMGKKISFEHLVARVSKDIRARPVLDEWLRVGVVSVDDNDYICLNTDAFVPNVGFDEKLYFFQQNIHDHIAATAHNLMNQTPPMLERCVYYDGLTPAAIIELKALAEEQGMVALKAVNKRALELQAEHKDLTTADQRFTFALYFYHAKEDLLSKTAYENHQSKRKNNA